MPFDSPATRETARAVKEYIARKLVPDPPPKIRETVTMKRIRALNRLLKLTRGEKDWDQRTFTTCLWSRAIQDEELLGLGLKPTPLPHNDDSNPEKVFGRGFNVWGCEPVTAKRASIREQIREQIKALEKA